MREILFRGKRTDNGEWVLGNLFIPDIKEKEWEICIGTSTVRITYEIDPATVGQYTGLCDKNGKKIFEGDIVSFQGEHYPVEFDIGMFYFAEAGHIGFAFDYFYGADLPIISVPVEVIGNTHDNPELLGEYENE